MKIIKNMDELKAFLKAAGNKLVVVEFSAKWCGPCKRISPLIHAMSQQYQNVMFASIDVDDAQELAEMYNIRAIPTFLLFKETQKGLFSRKQLHQHRKGLSPSGIVTGYSTSAWGGTLTRWEQAPSSLLPHSQHLRVPKPHRCEDTTRSL
ncbi:thioredoxin domain-containing protein 8 isoform X1 [Talpa occidentalis]|uniref:thioredoxin domain-containing protein 8 isoform X1 n=1 Tax=Talpa occidentalis TaxID=50954 RepID=UPI0023F956E7|nr:thioredoxin domain-containing protein 8 isoform X1 [Talpa occidentalis]